MQHGPRKFLVPFFVTSFWGWDSFVGSKVLKVSQIYRPRLSLQTPASDRVKSSKFSALRIQHAVEICVTSVAIERVANANENTTDLYYVIVL